MNAELLLMFTLGCDRAYLYAHPRVVTKPLAAPIEGRFDAVVEFSEKNILEVIHNPDLDASVQEYIRSYGPRLIIAANKGYNHFTYQRVELDGHDFASKLRLDRQRVDALGQERGQRLIDEAVPRHAGLARKNG